MAPALLWANPDGKALPADCKSPLEKVSKLEVDENEVETVKVEVEKEVVAATENVPQTEKPTRYKNNIDPHLVVKSVPGPRGASILTNENGSFIKGHKYEAWSYPLQDKVLNFPEVSYLPPWKVEHTPETLNAWPKNKVDSYIPKELSAVEINKLKDLLGYTINPEPAKDGGHFLGRGGQRLGYKYKVPGKAILMFDWRMPGFEPEMVALQIQRRLALEDLLLEIIKEMRADAKAAGKPEPNIHMVKTDRNPELLKRGIMVTEYIDVEPKESQVARGFKKTEDPDIQEFLKRVEKYDPEIIKLLATYYKYPNGDPFVQGFMTMKDDHNLATLVGVDIAGELDNILVEKGTGRNVIGDF
jgi:hypothetical protein